MDKNYWMKWGITGALAFASGHAAVFDLMYPCPAALLAVLVSETYSGWNLVMISALSLWLGRRRSLSVGCELTALLTVWLVLFLLRKKGASPVHRAVIAAITWTAAKGISLGLLDLSYRYGAEYAVSELTLVVVLTYIFFKLYAWIPKGKLPLVRPEGILVFLCTGAIFLKGILSPLVGLLPEPLSQFQILKAGLFFLVLWMGYEGGVKEGAVAGVTAGTLLLSMTAVSPMITTMLACGGMAAGLCKDEVKPVVSVVYAAAILLFRLVQGTVELDSELYLPLLVGGAFSVIPEGVWQRVRPRLALEGREQTYNLVTRQQVLQTLEGYRRTFEYLSRAYILQREAFREEPQIRSGRMIMAYQFKGMADAVGRLEEEVRLPSAIPLKKERRYRIKVGQAGASHDGHVSGDSVCFGEVKRGQYVVALSDGMGNGRRAAEESNLTVQTIYRLLSAGFQPELALRIMNSILLYRGGDEIYSTLDLALIDLYTGNLQLYKTGASLTLIRRDTQVDIVKIPALPMGIVGDIAVPSMEYQLHPGDQILMLSDGVAEAGRHQGIQWLTEMIVGLSSSDPQTVADLLVRSALRQAGEQKKEKDDMTAVVMVVQ